MTIIIIIIITTPPSTKIIIHDKPAIRGSWETRGYEGWYIGPALNHYRCHTVYAKHTAHERVADTVEFSPHCGKMPYISSAENAIIAARKLTHALQNPSPASPFSNVGDKQMGALHQLDKIFQQSVNENNDPPNSVAPPRVSPTRPALQAKVPDTPTKHTAVTPQLPHATPTSAHNTHPNRPNIIKYDHVNQPLGLDHGKQPLGLGLPPQSKTAMPHYIPPD